MVAASVYCCTLSIANSSMLTPRGIPGMHLIGLLLRDLCAREGSFNMDGQSRNFGCRSSCAVRALLYVLLYCKPTLAARSTDGWLLCIIAQESGTPTPHLAASSCVCLCLPYYAVLGAFRAV